MTGPMLKRARFLCLGLWLIAAGALSAHAGPCDMRDRAAAAEAAIPADAHAHCDMLASEAKTPQPDLPEPPDAPAKGSACCCPAVLAAVPAPDVPQAAEIDFSLPAGFPAEVRAVSRTLIPEPPPPKA